MRSWKDVFLPIGLLLVAIAVFLIVYGDILGERKVPAAVTLWIIASGFIMQARKARKAAKKYWV